ncbi:hypothetical protein NDU88_009412 [Pleurodeles waltl]|uniref:Uncharacterized protein n=1 Tax=Pleurodeles waltl TaxID=8319 RepID=A0AAV7PT72_PLEWA|nr:hypothetical protein NDU88_009412 [Pleurodeles waltl]
MSLHTSEQRFVDLGATEHAQRSCSACGSATAVSGTLSVFTTVQHVYCVIGCFATRHREVLIHYKEDEGGIEEDDELVSTIDCLLEGAVAEDEWKVACDNDEQISEVKQGKESLMKF